MDFEAESLRRTGRVVRVYTLKSGRPAVLILAEDGFALMRRNQFFACDADFEHGMPENLKPGNRVSFVAIGPSKPGQRPHAVQVRVER